MDRIIIFILSILFLQTSCTSRQKPEQTSAEKEVNALVIASSYPLYYFAHRMAGEYAQIEFPASESGDPAYWSPRPEQIERMQGANLIILNGASYEKWLDKVSLPASILVNSSEGLDERFIPLEGNVSHSHGPGGEHVHHGVAMTTWLDLSIALLQAERIKASLLKEIPEKTSSIESSFQTLQRDLKALDDELMKATEGLSDTYLYFSHPVYQYLKKRYGLEGHSLHWEPQEIPNEEMWAEFDHLLEHKPSGWMIWEGEPGEEIRQKLNQRRITCIVFNPVSGIPEEGDFVTVMQSNIKELQKIQ